MKKREIVTLTCRLFSLYVVYTVLVSVPGIAQMVLPPVEQHTKLRLLALSITLFLFTIFGVLLWCRAGRIATRLVSATKGAPSDSKPSLADLQTTAMSVLGMFVVTGSTYQIPEVSFAIMYSRRELFDVTRQMLNMPPAPALFASFIVRIAVGLGLLLGSRWLVGLLPTARTEGLPKSANRTA